MNDERLAHIGVLGMHWGKRNLAKNTTNLAQKDAKRHAEAKMFYGKGAGTRRKLLNAELEKKHKTIPGYTDAFNKHLENVDYAKAAKKAVAIRTRKDITYRTRVTAKQVLGVTGPLTVAAGTMLYQMNKEKVDATVIKYANIIYNKLRRS